MVFGVIFYPSNLGHFHCFDMHIDFKEWLGDHWVMTASVDNLSPCFDVDVAKFLLYNYKFSCQDTDFLLSCNVFFLVTMHMYWVAVDYDAIALC